VRPVAVQLPVSVKLFCNVPARQPLMRTAPLPSQCIEIIQKVRALEWFNPAIANSAKVHPVVNQ